MKLKMQIPKVSHYKMVDKICIECGQRNNGVHRGKKLCNTCGAFGNLLTVYKYDEGEYIFPEKKEHYTILSVSNNDTIDFNTARRILRVRD